MTTDSWTVLVLADGDRTAVAGARIAARSVASSWIDDETELAQHAATTATDGSCQMPMFEVDELLLAVDAAGFVRREVRLAPPNRGERIAVSLRSEVVDRVLVRAAVTAAPIEGARVFAQPSTFAPMTSRHLRPNEAISSRVDASHAVTDAAGLGTLRGVAEGFHDLSVSASGWCAVDYRAVEMPLPNSPLVVELEPGSPIDALVVDAEGHPKVGWRVTFSGKDHNWLVWTDENGRARSPGFAMGTRVTVSVARKDLDPAAMVTEAFLRPIRTTVEVPVAETVRLVTTSGYRHPVEVAWAPGEAEDMLELQLLQELANGGHGLSQSIRVSASNGRATLGASAAVKRARYVVQGLGSRSGLWRSELFTVDDGRLLVPLRERQPRTGAIFGRVTSRDGSGAADSDIRLFAVPASLGVVEPTLVPRSDAKLQKHIRTDPDGNFFCDLLLPGRYTIEVSERLGKGIGVRVLDVVEAVRCDLVLAASGEIRGQVDHMPSDAHLQVAIASVATSRRLYPVVEADGTFRAGSLPSGDYRVGLLQRTPIAVGGAREPIQEVSVVVRADDVAVCRLDASSFSRSTRVVVLGVPPQTECEVQLERLYPFDRVGNQVWRVRQKLPRSNVATFSDLDGSVEYAVSIRAAGRPTPLAWTVVPMGAAEVRLLVGGGTSLVVRGSADLPGLFLVPATPGGVPVRDSLIHPTSAEAQRVVFEGLSIGTYLLVSGSHQDHCARIDASIRVDVGAGSSTVEWRGSR